MPAERVLLHYGLGKFGTNVPPFILRAPPAQTLAAGSPAALILSAWGDPAPKFPWYKDGSLMLEATGPALTWSSTDFSDTGDYSVEIENVLGITSCEAKLSISPPPRFCNLTNTLVLHLKFDGDSLDSSGRSNHGVAVGSPSFIAGRIGSGALHYGTDVTTGKYNYVTLGVPADLQFSSNLNFTVSFWVRFVGLSGDLPFLCNSVNSFGQPGFTFAPSYMQGGWSWSLAPTQPFGWSCIQVYGGDNSINDGEWHHLLHSFDREGEATTYLDGRQVHSTCIILGPLQTLSRTNRVNIGQDSTGLYAESGEAEIDDLGVWRRALSAYEAQCVFLVGKNYGLSFDSYGPVNISVVHSPGGNGIVWQEGFLESADDIEGPWAPVPGAVAPYCRIAIDGIRKFYRVRL